jgi:tetratricopeptide (TPR) repeat protein
LVYTIIEHPAFLSWDDANKLNPMFHGYADGAKMSGYFFWKKNDWRRASEFFSEAIRCYEKITSRSDLVLQELAIAYINLGASKGKMNHLEPAIQAYNKAESILASCTDINDKCDSLLSDCVTQKGNLFGTMRRYDLERVEYEKALVLSRKRGRSKDALHEGQVLSMLIEKSIGQEQMDAEAKKFGLMLKEDVPHDGDCFFSAALILLNKVKPPFLRNRVKPNDLRRKTVDYLRKHQSDFAAFVEGTFETYLADMDNEGTWADYPAFCAFAQCFKVTLVMLPSNGSTPTVIYCDAPRAVVTLGHVAGAHFQPLYRTSEEFAPSLQKIINDARPRSTEEALPSERANKVRRTVSVGGVGEGVRVTPPCSPSAKSNAFFPPAPDATAPAVCTGMQTADAVVPSTACRL